MKADIKPGKYIVAVSGGVDSVVLLDILSRDKQLELVVAHFNHGIRENSSDDEEFVARRAAAYGLPVKIGYGKLGANASEAEARAARYAFLDEVQKAYEAKSIITAHHEDDLIETALINILRGTGPKGLTAMHDNKRILRPLLAYPKKDILVYARLNNINWIEDSTNKDNKHLRNYLRNIALLNLKESDRQKLLARIRAMQTVNKETYDVIAKISQQILINNTTLDRAAYITLPPEVSTAFLMFWLDSLEAGSLDRKTVLRLANALKTAPAGSSHEVRRGSKLAISKKQASFKR